MSARSRPQKPQIKAAPRPRRAPHRHKQQTPSSPDFFPWRANEIVIGVPRADRKARKGDDNV
jgi:hypothetical protein